MTSHDRMVEVDATRRKVEGRALRTGRLEWTWSTEPGERVVRIQLVPGAPQVAIRTNRRRTVVSVSSGSKSNTPAHAATFTPTWLGFGTGARQLLLRGADGAQWRRWEIGPKTQTQRIPKPPWFRPMASPAMDRRNGWSPRRTHLAEVRFEQRQVLLKAMPKGNLLGRFQIPKQLRRAGQTDPEDQHIEHTAVSRGARWLAVTTSGIAECEATAGELRLIHRASASQRVLWKARFVTPPVFDPSGRHVAVATFSEVQVFEVTSGRRVARAAYPGELRHLGLDASGRILALVEKPSQHFALWQLNPKRRLLQLPGGLGVLPATFSPHQRYLATAHLGGTVYLWKIPQ